MKKLIVLSMAAAIAVSMASCGSSKPSVQASSSEQENPYGQKVFKSDCQKMAEAMPGKRFWGQAEHFKQSSATQLAELDARTKISNKIDAAITAAAEMADVDLTKYSGTRDDGMSGTDAGAKQNTLGQSVSQNIVSGTTNINTEAYYGKNRKYTVFVCIELDGTTADLAESATKKIVDRIDANDRAKIESDIDKFKDRIEKELNK